jgi:SH3-like domain-containing protein
VEESDGAKVRIQPDFNAPLLTTMFNGYLVYVLPETVDNGNTTWVHIRLTDGREGWIVRSLLATATPAPGW